MTASSSSRLLWAWALAVVLSASPGTGQTESTGDETFEGSTEVVLVEVPVRVILDGRPLIGLTAADFEVYDRGDRQEITHFEVVDFRRTGEETWESGPESIGERHFLFVIDLAYPARSGPAFSRSILSTSRHLHRNVGSLAEFLSTSLGSEDRWAVAYNSPLRAVKLLQPWTSDAAAIEPTVEILDAIALAKPKRVERAFDEWQRSRADKESWPQALLPTREDLMAEARTASVRADPFLPQLRTIQNLTDGLTDLTDSLGQVAGARHLIYLSSGFPLAEDGTSAPILERLQQLFRHFRGTGWAIDAINPVGADLVGGSLFLITHETGGQLHTNSRELSELLERVASHTSYSYVLGFNPAEIEANGRYHRLKVKLVDGPKSAELVHRRGYYAPDEAAVPSSTGSPGA